MAVASEVVLCWSGAARRRPERLAICAMTCSTLAFLEALTSTFFCPRIRSRLSTAVTVTTDSPSAGKDASTVVTIPSKNHWMLVPYPNRRASVSP